MRIGTDGNASTTRQPNHHKMCSTMIRSRLVLVSSVCALVSFSEAFQASRRIHHPASPMPAHQLANPAADRRICPRKIEAPRRGSLHLPAKSKTASTSDEKTNTSQRKGRQQKTKGRRKPPTPLPRRKRAGRPSTKGDVSLYQRMEMLNHRVLSREEELELGRRIAVATALRDRLTDLLDSRRVERELYGDRRRRGDGMGLFETYEERDSHVRNLPLDEELFQLGMGSSFSSIQQNGDDDDNTLLLSEEGGFTIIDQSSNDLAEDLSGFDNSDGDVPVALQEGSKFSMRRLERDLAQLSNQDVGERLGVAGGKDEARTIIREGAEARQEMMRCNIKLVVSIAKKWIKGNPEARAANRSLRDLYDGGWDRPSLDEAIQEGILGLSRAIDKYDYEKGLKFSTYSTWWITNYVRIAFQTAKTGPLKLPAQFYTLKNQYFKAIASLTREGRPIPPIEDFANEFGTSVRRLQNALTATEGLFSIDQPMDGQSTKLRGSSAGEIGVGNGDIYLSDALVCNEPSPEELVELSFLRQSLENALATELSPHERDVVRLRLGLDDGQARTAKEVATICGDMIQPDHVRRAEKRAFKKLSSPSSLYQHHLQDYLYLIGGVLDDEFALKVFR